MMLLPSCGAAVTVMLGCLGLLFPKAVGRVIGIEPESPLGITEFRATYGGFFLCLGIGCLVAQSAQVFAVVGAAWCTAAFARLLSYPVDGGRARHNLAGAGVEAGIGLAMLSAQF